MTGAGEEPLEGQTFGRYRLERLIGKGGMGEVYLATLAGSHGFEKRFALKVLSPELARSSRIVTMFLDEVRVASRIQHTNVCSVVDFGFDGGVPYLVMEHLRGTTLDRLLRSVHPPELLPPRIAARIVADAAQGLHAAHELRGDDGAPLGVVHRDVSPKNVFVLDEGVVKVLDFGVATMKGRFTVTLANEFKGTFSYMAPERFKGASGDRRADVWSLGVILWEATVGERLFAPADLPTVMARVLHQAIPRPTSVLKSYPRELEEVVMAALERDEDRRTETAARLVEELERFIYSAGAPTGAMQVAAFVARGTHRRADVDVSPAPVTLPRLANETELLEDFAEPPRDRSEVAAPLPSPDEPARPRARRALGWLVLGSLPVIALATTLGWLLCPDLAVEEAPGAGAGPPPWVRTDALTSGDVTSAAPPAPALPDRTAAPTSEDRDHDADASNGTEASDEPVDRPLRQRPRERSRPSAPTPNRPEPGPPEEPDSRPEAATARPGSLNLLAIPNVDVFWRGERLGRTPLFERPLPAGRHTLELRPVDGGPPQRLVIEIFSGRSTSRSVRVNAEAPGPD